MTNKEAKRRANHKYYMKTKQARKSIPYLLSIYQEEIDRVNSIFEMQNGRQ